MSHIPELVRDFMYLYFPSAHISTPRSDPKSFRIFFGPKHSVNDKELAHARVGSPCGHDWQNNHLNAGLSEDASFVFLSECASTPRPKDNPVVAR